MKRYLKIEVKENENGDLQYDIEAETFSKVEAMGILYEALSQIRDYNSLNHDNSK